MKHSIVLRLIALAFTLSAIAVSGQVSEVWRASFDGPDYDAPRAIGSDSQGNTYVTGISVQSGGGKRVIVMFKYAPDGHLLWSTTYVPNIQVSPDPRAMTVDQAGNLYVAGSTFSSFWLVKYDTNGQLQWEAIRGGVTWYESDIWTALAVDSSGNVYAAGSQSGQSISDTKLIFDKYDSDGNLVWTSLNSLVAGGPVSVVVDASGSVYAEASGFDLGPSGYIYNYLTLRLAPDGHLLWTNHYQGPQGKNHVPVKLVIDGQGNAYTTGTSTRDASQHANEIGDATTLKYDADGNLLWVARYEGDVNQGTYGEDIAIDGMGNVFVACPSTRNSGPGVRTATIKYDPSGNQLWIAYASSPGHFDWGLAVCTDSQGNAYVLGGTDADGVWSTFDWGSIVAKYTPSGVQQWTARSYAASDAFNPLGLTVTTDGLVVVTGTAGPDDEHAQSILTVALRGGLAGDANGDGRVSLLDLALVLREWGQGALGLPGDLNGDGAVDIVDVAIVLHNYGRTR